MNHGTRPTRIKHKDYDFLKSHRFGGVVPVFKDEYFADAGLTMPNQDIVDADFTPPTPAMPFGCTNFSQAELATDLTKQIHNPSELEAVTHANSKGGLDIRESLEAAVGLGWFKQFFNIRTSGLLDYFDVFRIAQTMGIDAGEDRSITWGTPWFPSWEKAALAGQYVMPMPTAEEIADAQHMSWHDSKLDGWTTRNGILVYRDKSWQGTNVGEGGFIAFPREVINMVMSIDGTVGFTGSLIGVDKPKPIDVTKMQWIVSFIHNLLEKYV